MLGSSGNESPALPAFSLLETCDGTMKSSTVQTGMHFNKNQPQSLPGHNALAFFMLSR